MGSELVEEDDQRMWLDMGIIKNSKEYEFYSPRSSSFLPFGQWAQTRLSIYCNPTTTTHNCVPTILFSSKCIYFKTKLQLVVAEDPIPWLISFFSLGPTCFLAQNSFPMIGLVRM
jgi:hypothetical protein